jgi:translocation and assembly module TamB
MDSPRSLFRRLLKALALGLLLLVLLGAGAYLLRDRLLQDLLRPLLVRELSRRFQIELTVDRLLLHDGVVQVEGLQIEAAETGRLELSLLELELDWGILHDRSLSKLVLAGPKLTLFPAKTVPGPDQPVWPKLPPLRIDALEIHDGELLIPGAAKQGWRINGQGTLGRHWTLELHLQPEPAAAQTLDLQAKGSWDGAIRSEIEHFQWQGRELLAEPLQLALVDGRLTELSGELELAKLTDTDLHPLLAAFGRSLSETQPWLLEGLRVRPSLEGGELRLAVQVAALKVGDKGRRTLLQEVVLAGHASAAGQPVKFELGALLGPAGDPVALAGQVVRADPSTLELTRIDWRGQALLVRPLLVSWQGGAASITTGLMLAELDDRSLRPLLALADIQLPPDPHWTLHELVLDPTWDGEQLQLKAAAGSAAIRSGKREITLGRVGLNLSGRSGRWELSIEGLLDANSRLQGELKLRGETLDGRVGLELTNLAGLPLAQPGFGLPALAGAGSLVIKVSGTASQPSLAVQVSTHDLTLQDSSGFSALELRASAAVGRRKAGWRLVDGTLAGSLSGQLAATLTGTFSGRLAAGSWSAKLAELKIEKLSWSSPDGLSVYAGERLLLHGELTAIPGLPAGFALNGELAGGELLHDAYYASLEDISARFGLQGDIAAGNWRIERAHMDIPQLGEISLDGLLGSAESRLSATLALPDLRQTLETHGRKLLGEPFPALKKLSLAGGLKIVANGFRNAQGWGLRLNLEPHQVALDWGEEAHLAGLSGALPLQLGTAAADEVPGQLTWTGLTLGPLRGGAGELPIRSRPGRLQLPGGMHLGLAGGELILADLDLVLPPQALEVSTRMTVAGVELQALSQQLGWPEMRGALSADLGRLHYQGGELSIAGEARLEVFAGQIRVGNMHARELFSRYPVVLADIDFSGIDLYRLTNTFAFGEMNGVIDGHVHQLRLFGGTATQFEAALRTRDSGTRNISVKALNNLSILSQGGLSAALSRGLYRFIDFYRYRSIGIDCSLDNDLFRLRGTAREGSDQYLVYGGLLPPRIDVVTSAPTVSFREMVKRLKRIDRTGGSGTPH